MLQGVSGWLACSQQAQENTDIRLHAALRLMTLPWEILNPQCWQPSKPLLAPCVCLWQIFSLWCISYSQIFLMIHFLEDSEKHTVRASSFLLLFSSRFIITASPCSLLFLPGIGTFSPLRPCFLPSASLFFSLPYKGWGHWLCWKWKETKVVEHLVPFILWDQNILILFWYLCERHFMT